MSAPRETASHSIGAVFLFALVGMFALFSLLLTLLGTSVYRNVVESGDRDVSGLNVAQYLTNRVRASDAEGALRVEDDMLLCDAGLGGAYLIYVYEYDGALCEALATPDTFDPSLGERLFPIRKMDVVSEADRVSFFIVTEDGKTVSARVTLRAGHGGE